MVSLSVCVCNRTLYLCAKYTDQWVSDLTCSVDSNSLSCVTLTAQQQSAITTYWGPTTACAAGICNAGYAAPAGGSCTACAPGVLVCLYVCTTHTHTHTHTHAHAHAHTFKHYYMQNARAAQIQKFSTFIPRI